MNSIIIFSQFLCILTVSMCSSNSFDEANYTTIKGVVEFTYIKDTLGTDRYWFYSSELQADGRKHNFIKNSGDILSYALVFCDSLEEKRFIKKNSLKSLEMYEEYQSQKTIDKTDYYTHYGGDTYLKGMDTLVITMNIHASFAVWDSPPCDGFNIVSRYSCPVKPKGDFYPIAILNDIYSIKSLSKEEVKRRKLKKYKYSSFLYGECE